MIIRVGVEGGRKQVLNKVRELDAPILVSANSLWDDTRKRFSGWHCYSKCDTALDSGGFVAMKRYGGFRWTVDQYVSLAKEMNPSWWAQMDFCCEPEVALNRSTVWKRIEATAAYLNECQSSARRQGSQMPVPVLQGWRPADYCEGPIYEWEQWPDLVGIGSVCRRNVTGPEGILAVVHALDRMVPRNVQFHLFGVKSAAIEELLANFPDRIASVDSMAWNVACRRKAYACGVPCNGKMRAEFMARWYLRQRGRTLSPRSRQLQFQTFLSE